MRWSDIYGLLATACGYSYPIIDEMTLFDAEELVSYWTDHPPVHLLLAAFMGVGQNTGPLGTPRRDDFVRGPSLCEIMTLPGVGQTIRPLSSGFGPDAVDEMMAMLLRFETSAAARKP
jgi:hypothetical protein